MKTTTKTVIEVDYNELDGEVTRFLRSKNIEVGEYGYECTAEEEWGNDSSHELNVDGKLDDFFEKYDKPDILKGKLSYKLSAILNWMAAEKVIEPGKYLVNVCW